LLQGNVYVVVAAAVVVYVVYDVYVYVGERECLAFCVVLQSEMTLNYLNSSLVFSCTVNLPPLTMKDPSF
jgi:hypothetical protein